MTNHLLISSHLLNLNTKKISLVLGLATFGFGFLLGILPHAARRVYEAEERNKEKEEQYRLQNTDLAIINVKDNIERF